MKNNNIKNMKLGWFVGNFNPSIYKTKDIEVAVKEYPEGSHEEWHYHEIATEITVIVKGRVKMNGSEYKSGDIIIIEPMEGTDFEVLENTITTVVKIPSVCNDKFIK